MLRGALGALFPWADNHRLGAVPDRGRGLGQTAPTYICRDLAGSNAPTAFAASILPAKTDRAKSGIGMVVLNGDSIDPSSITAVKKELRATARARRAALSERQRQAEAHAVTDLDLGFLGVLDGAEVAGYAPIGDEFDPAPLLDHLAAKGARLSLPRITDDRRDILFHRWRPGERTSAGVWGIREPEASADLVVPSKLLVPMLAFDRQGWRLGYGGGYYDRAIARLRRGSGVIALGLAFSCQEVDVVPHLDYDEPLDWVVTAEGARRLAG